MISIGMIGFGEAAYYITCGIKHDCVKLLAYDVAASQNDERAMLLEKRAADNDVYLVANLAELFEKSDIIFCMTSADSALPIAKQAAPLLKKGQIYVDLNSTSPETKKQIDEELSTQSEGMFVEAAIMSSVPANKSRVPVLLCGKCADTVVKAVTDVGMNFSKLSDQIGAASAMKMIKSVLFKGFIALLTETVFAADRYGITEKTLAAFKSIMSEEMTFEECCNYFLCTGATHCERLEHEEEEVTKTLQALGENTIMTCAAAKKFQWLVEKGFHSAFSVRPQNYETILEYKRTL